MKLPEEGRCIQRKGMGLMTEHWSTQAPRIKWHKDKDPTSATDVEQYGRRK